MRFDDWFLAVSYNRVDDDFLGLFRLCLFFLATLLATFSFFLAAVSLRLVLVVKVQRVMSRGGFDVCLL